MDIFLPRPINAILEGNKNYLSWSQAMRNFLQGRMLWQYCAGTITIPIKRATDTTFISFMVECDSHNHMILTWIRNTSISSISNLLQLWWCKICMRYVGQKILHFSRIHEILVSGWVASTQPRTRAIYQWLLWSASFHLGPNWPFWSNFGMLKGCSTICYCSRWILTLWILDVT